VVGVEAQVREAFEQQPDGRSSLRPGQVVRTVIDGIGELVNECVAETAAPSAP